MAQEGATDLEKTAEVKTIQEPSADVLSLNASQGDGVLGSKSEKSESHRTKRRYPYGPLFFILGSSVGQSYSATGLQSVLELYFTRFLYVCTGSHKQSLSTTSVNVYIALYQLCAISSGFLADKVIGNFLTQVGSNIVITIGICLMTFASWQYTLEEPHCCGLNATESSDLDPDCSALQKDVLFPHANLHISPGVNLALAITGLVLFAIGYGHYNAIQSVFVGDQFQEEQSKAKERSFSWYYLCLNVGSFAGEGGMPILRQSVGFVITWLTVVGATVTSTGLYVAGSCLYIKKKPQENACHSCRSRLRHKNTQSETEPLLKDAKQSHDTMPPAGSSSPVSLRTRLKQLVPIAGVFAPLVVFWAIYYQQNSTWVTQGAMMDCYLGRLHVPPDLMPSVEDLMVVSIIPFLDYLVYPHLERVSGRRVLPLHKLVAGMICAVLSFLMAGLLQLYIHQPLEDCHGNVSIAWQLPQLVIISFAEVLISVTGLEFAYSQAPPDFRNIITAFWSITQALGTLLNAGVAQIPMSMTYAFFVYLVLMVIVTAMFVVINRNFRYRDGRERQTVVTTEHEPEVVQI